MCGIFGILAKSMPLGESRQRVQSSLRTMAHRGPDGDGIFVDEDAGLVLGHRRLAIIDPEHGKQPMLVDDGEYALVFNGAIYNYLELRRELVEKGWPIHSFSDTEVLLYSYREWGDDCVNKFLGMFAFAIWDKRKKRLFCARDRIGIKPFYYFTVDDLLVFSSEIKAILSTGLVDATPDKRGLHDYLTFQFCLGDKTLFRDIHKLEPGHLLIAELGGKCLTVTIKQYWDVTYEIDEDHDERWFVDHLAGLIEDSIRLHLRSDVPLGAHLSGGLDSSAIVCLAAGLLKGERLRTFTGAFPEGPQFDETVHAKRVSTFAGTEYQDVFIDGAELPDILPKLMYYMDEPLAGPGVIPQYYVSRLAAQHVKVVLGGQGGDELFIGYARYMVAYLEQCLIGAIYETSASSRHAVTLESIVPNLPLLKTYQPMLQGLWQDGLFDDPDKRYFKLVDRSASISHLFSPDIFDRSYSPFSEYQRIFNRAGLDSLINRMTYFDLKGSLPALLHVEDRTSMAASIESRVPLLDHRIVEFMARIPPNVKFSGGRMKHLFKESVRNAVPRETLERKDKMGFPTPLTQWANGVAKEFVRDTLLSGRLRQRGIYNVSAVEGVLRNEREFGRAVWGLLCLEIWHQGYVDGNFKLNAS